jgi:hypothetical protein
MAMWLWSWVAGLGAALPESCPGITLVSPTRRYAAREGQPPEVMA